MNELTTVVGTERICVRTAGDTIHVTLDDPQTRNAVSRTMYHELAFVLSQIAGRQDLRFVVLGGAGGVFSSGGDLRELADGLPDDYVTDYWQRMSGTILTLRAMPQIVIAGVRGAAVGAGAAVALASDMVVMERDARMRFTFTRIGFLPDAGTTVMLPRLLGPAIARDLLFTGRWIGAEEACHRGMVARVCEPGAVDDTVDDLIAELRHSPAGALGMVKNLVDASALGDLTSGVRAEGVQQYAAAASGEYREYLARVLAVMAGPSAPATPATDPDPDADVTIKSH
ncbi:enoyl-CoA hydratase/isomerase family protein [Microbacterium sp. zg-Y818]|uniref:enoyl-CoA hydratase/isomerase family protein n=1 Tax=unclassified Microbacterium TaxID=2609290 RepID=UPI00214D0CFF|nr:MULTISPECIES: enoyl-CoA hydratase/isomerase family protein [unclassified Microbacterium]MCR2799316.1 enoyl-CoA hydratase/isomerase family protein [Microbacterium sp. zg.Y818]WIM21317.1 enoyl-CoA hydratase/isomerase family protein [Microbacterium sp. zg-Y818]